MSDRHTDSIQYNIILLLFDRKPPNPNVDLPNQYIWKCVVNP